MNILSHAEPQRPQRNHRTNEKEFMSIVKKALSLVLCGSSEAGVRIIFFLSLFDRLMAMRGSGPRRENKGIAG
jgi:hypothetical protein